MILDHIAQASCRLVKRSALSDSETLGKSYLHAGNVIAVPYRFQERIGKAKIEDIHDRLLPKEVIDAKDGVFGEDCPGDAVEFPGGGQVTPERLLYNDARVLR